MSVCVCDTCNSLMKYKIITTLRDLVRMRQTITWSKWKVYSVLEDDMSDGKGEKEVRIKNIIEFYGRNEKYKCTFEDRFEGSEEVAV